MNQNSQDNDLLIAFEKMIDAKLKKLTFRIFNIVICVGLIFYAANVYYDIQKGRNQSKIEAWKREVQAASEVTGGILEVAFMRQEMARNCSLGSGSSDETLRSQKMLVNAYASIISSADLLAVMLRLPEITEKAEQFIAWDKGLGNDCSKIPSLTTYQAKRDDILKVINEKLKPLNEL